MNKKILIVFFILALSVCLSFAISASNYIDYSSIDNSISGQGSVLTFFSDQNDFVSTLNERLGVIVVASRFDSDFIYSFGFSNIEYWNSLLENRVSNADEFLLFIESGIDSGYWNSTMNMYKLLSQYYQEFWNAYHIWRYNDYYYSLIDCQNFHILKNTYYTFDYNGVTYKSVIEQYCPKCDYTGYELSSDVFNFLDVFLDTATDDEILNFDFYTNLKLYILENSSNVVNEQVLNEFVDKLVQIDGIKQAHVFTSNWLEENNILGEPWGATGELSALEGLLEDNVLPAINNAYNNGYSAGYSTGEDEGKAAGYTEGVNAALTRMESWLTGESILFQSYDKDGDAVTVAQYLDGNILPALRQKYNIGKNDGIAIGETTSDSLKEGIFAIFSAPVDMIARILNFELFGINLFYLISGILTLSLVIFVIKKIKG